MAAPPDNLSKTESIIPGAGQSESAETPVTTGLVGRLRSVMLVLGPGLVTGASDDDPSGIATYSQVGAQFGYGMLWTMVVSYPLMTGIQEVSARIGRVTGCGISANLRRCYPRSLLGAVIALVLVANIFNLGADIGAMGATAQLLLPGKEWIYVVAFGVVSLLLQILVPYTSYVKYLKWLTLSLFAYVATAFFVKISWHEVVRATVLPQLSWSKDYLTGLIAVLGTTISPYLFFWQASQEVEDLKSTRGEKPLKRARRQATAQLGRIRIDTYFGMALSNAVAFFIILTTAATLHAHGQTDVSTAAQAAQALAPLAGRGVNSICLRNYWHGHAGNTGTCRVSSLRYGRGLQLDNQFGEKAQGGSRLLHDYRGRHLSWHCFEFYRDQPNTRSVLGCGLERRFGSPADGRHHAYGVEQEGDG